MVIFQNVLDESVNYMLKVRTVYLPVYWSDQFIALTDDSEYYVDRYQLKSIHTKDNARYFMPN